MIPRHCWIAFSTSIRTTGIAHWSSHVRKSARSMQHCTLRVRSSWLAVSFAADLFIFAVLVSVDGRRHDDAGPARVSHLE